jgi:hypothetical protein
LNMNRKTVVTIGVTALVVAGLTVALLTSFPAHTPGSSTAAAIALALPPATTGPITTVPEQIACARAAIDAHDVAVENANNALFVTEQVAYSARATALDEAYSGTTWASVVAPTNAALLAFNLAIAQAASTSQAARITATAQYNAAIAACESRSELSS